MQFTAFESGDDLADWLARHVGQQLQSAIDTKGRASLAVSGGKTPLKFFKALSHQDIGWKQVIITLVDERWVEPTSPRSNARLVSENLLQGKAASSAFLPLYRAGMDPGHISQIDNELAALLPLDIVILGMGIDGHTASFFPGASKLAAATAPDCSQLLIDMEGEGEPRVTMTLPVIISAGEVLLHIEGQQKRNVLDEAKIPGDPADLPIRYILNARSDIHTLWAP